MINNLTHIYFLLATQAYDELVDTDPDKSNGSQFFQY